MALAYVCDRCGKTFSGERYSEDRRYAIFDKQSDNRNLFDMGRAPMDLCDSCYKRLEQFIICETEVTE